MTSKRKKTKYTKKELKVFEKIINKRIDEASTQLDFYLNSLKARGENADAKVKGLSDGNGSIEIERLSTLAARQRKLITHLQNAKLRIENGIYGICRETGNLISSERLRAVPHATLSIAAKQSQGK